MRDTIEMLDAIGSDASLRHASAEELAHALEQAQASPVLATAVASGDSSLLFAELGHKPMYSPQVSQTPGHEEDEPTREETDEPVEPGTPDRSNTPAKH